jgi:hypothetical protein
MLSPTSLVLVGLLPTPRDLEIARFLGWYRIPLRRAPKVIAVDYLAMYQPASFGEAGGRIEYVAPVHGHELTTRGQLLKDEADHPRAREEYYRLQLGELERLPQAILAERWKRLSFLYTTGEYLLQARSLNDLVIRTDERALLWRSLRERADPSREYSAHPAEPEIPADVLAALLGLQGSQSADGSDANW